MRILVLGKRGQVARALSEISPARGVKALALGRPDLDITNRSTIDRGITTFKPDIVINAAAYTGVDRAESEPDLAFAINRTGAKNAAEAAAAAKIPIIHISTDYVFDGRSQRPYREDDEPAPLSVYGSSKLEGEYAVAEATPDHLILRTSWVFSPFGHNFLKTMLKLCDEAVVKVVNDQTGRPTYAPDFGRAILDICASWSVFNLRGLMHVAGTGETNWFVFARYIFEALAAYGRRCPQLTPITTADNGAAAKRPAMSVLDCRRFERATGMGLPHWQDATKRCVKRLVKARTGVNG